MSKLQEFFSKKWWLIAAPIIYLVGALGIDIYYMITYEVGDGLYYLGGDIFVALVALFVCLSYFKHNKNVMKALVGGLLIYTCANNIGYAVEYLVFYIGIWEAILGCAVGLLSLAFFVIHLLLAASHKSNAKLVNANMIIGILFVLITIAWEIYCIIVWKTEIYYAICWSLNAIGLVLLVMNIESKIDYFKQIRDQKEESIVEE